MHKGENFWQLDALLEKALKFLQNTTYKQDPKNLDTLASILRSINYFQKKLEAPNNLYDFLELAKSQLHYEIHPMGSILLQENECAEKFFVILKGEVQKIQQKDESLNEDESVKIQRNNRKMKSHVIQRPVEKKTTVKLTSKNMLERELTRQKTGTINEDGSPVSDSPRMKLKRVFSRIKTLREASPDGKVQIDDSSLQKQKSEPESKLLSLSPLLKGRSLKQGKTLFSFSPTLKPLDEKPRIQEFRLHTMPEAEEPIEQDDSSLQIEEALEKNESKTRQRKKMKNWPDFIKFVARKNPDIQSRLYNDDKIRVQKGGDICRGGYFGENFWKQHRPKEKAFIVTSADEVHLLSFTRETFLSIMEDLAKQARERAQFFVGSLPSVDRETVQAFSAYFCKRTFKKGDVICNQNDKTESLYLLKSGDVRLLKTFEAKQVLINSLMATPKASENTELPIVSVAKSQFFGEEYLVGKEYREYTAVSNLANTTVYFLELNTFCKIEELFLSLFRVLQEQTFKRFRFRQQRVSELLGKSPSLSPNRYALEPLSIEAPAPLDLGSPLYSSLSTGKDKKAFSLLSLQPNSATNKEGTRRTLNAASMSSRAKVGTLAELEKERGEVTERSPETKLFEPHHFEKNLQNLHLYKQKFSRKAQQQQKEEQWQGFYRKTEESAKTVETVLNTSTGLGSEFNVRKELGIQLSTKPKGFGLPALSIEKGTETSRPQNISYTRIISQQLSDRKILYEEGKLGLGAKPNSPERGNNGESKVKLMKLLNQKEFLTSMYGYKVKKAEEFSPGKSSAQLNTLTDGNKVASLSINDLNSQILVKVKGKKKDKFLGKKLLLKSNLLP